nr:hypothetical protein BaRGS_008606 [Batillaria attramentaria]
MNCKTALASSHLGLGPLFVSLLKLLPVVPAVLVCLLVVPCSSRADIKVNLHALVPHHFAMGQEINDAFMYSFLPYRRDRRYSSVFSMFTPTNNITALREDTPPEILSTLCRDVVGKNNTVTLVTLNNPMFFRPRTKANTYIMDLAESLGMPVISWDAEFSG